MDRATRQIVAAVPGLETHFFAEHGGGLCVEKWRHLRHGGGPPVRPARIRHGRGVALARQVHFSEQPADGRALARVDFLQICARHAGDYACRLAVQLAQDFVFQIGYRLRARNAVTREVRHQVHIERQLVRLQLFKQREHVTAVRRGHEIIGVLDAGSDALEFNEGAERIIFEPRCKLFRRDDGEYGHDELPIARNKSRCARRRRG